MVTVLHENTTWVITARVNDRLCIRRGGIMKWVGEEETR